MDNRLRAFLIAIGEIGQCEWSEGNNPRIIEYHSHTTLKAKDQKTPWCAAFVNWVLNQAGIKGTMLANAKSFLNWGKATDTPVKGCVCIFNRGSNPAHGHVGFFVSELGENIFVLGGNQGNMVTVMPYKKKDLVGYRVY